MYIYQKLNLEERLDVFEKKNFLNEEKGEKKVMK